MQPVSKTSKCRKRTRRAHQALRPVNLTSCPKCGAAKLPHAACDKCGYVSREIVLPQEKEES